MTGLVTLADLDRIGRLLLVWCDCGHRAELRAAEIGLPMSTPVPGIDRFMRCSSCGAKNSPAYHPIKTLMDPRQAGVTGRYPAL